MKTFLAAILGLNFSSEATESSKSADGLLGSFDSETGSLTLTSSDVKKIHRKYATLDRNRQDFLMMQRKEKQKERHGETNPVLFRPRISEKSELLAKKKRPQGKN